MNKNNIYAKQATDALRWKQKQKQQNKTRNYFIFLNSFFVNMFISSDYLQ